MTVSTPLLDRTAAERPYALEWYLDWARSVIAELEGEALPLAAQLDTVWGLHKRFLRNRAENDKKVLTGAELDDFLACCGRIALLLDEATLASRIAGVPEHFRRWLLGLRGQTAGPVTVELQSVMALDGHLVLHGLIDDAAFAVSGQIVLDLGKADHQTEQVVLRDDGLRHDFRYFGRSLVAYRAFDLRLPLDCLTPGTVLRWRLADDPSPAPLRFATWASRFAPELGATYTRFGEIALLAGVDRLEVVAPTAWRTLTSELRALWGLRNARLRPKVKLLEFGLRVVFNLTRPLRRRRFVLYFDKLYMGGDNGQHLFEYASQEASRSNAKGSHRYLVQGHTREYRDLKQRGFPVIDYASPWRKLYTLHSHLICGTHSNVLSYCGLSRFERRWFSNAFDFHVVCIQHGLTVQHIPNLQARWVDNTERYYCASPAEIAEISGPEYGFCADQWKLTGLARFDALVSDEVSPTVLLAPTWRRYATSDATRMGHPRGYTESFLDSAWWAAYSQVLTDPELIAALGERGWKLRLLLHPTLVEQASDFENLLANHPAAREVCEVVPSNQTGYVPHLLECGVLVTDYSGIQFDFAWLRKPVLYYHLAELEPSYATGGYDPATNGLGPSLTSLPDLRATLLQLLDRGSRADPTYAVRVEEFFAGLSGPGSSARIYRELCKEYDIG